MRHPTGLSREPVDDTAGKRLQSISAPDNLAELSCLRNICIPACDITLVLLSHATVVKRIGIIGIEPDGLIIILDSAVVFAPAAIDYSAVIEAVGVVRIESDRLSEVVYGTAVLAVPRMGDSAVNEGIGIVRVEPYGFVIILDGAVVLARLVVNVATIVKRLRIVSLSVV